MFLKCIVLHTHIKYFEYKVYKIKTFTDKPFDEFEVIDNYFYCARWTMLETSIQIFVKVIFSFFVILLFQWICYFLQMFEYQKYTILTFYFSFHNRTRMQIISKTTFRKMYWRGFFRISLISRVFNSSKCFSINPMIKFY